MPAKKANFNQEKPPRTTYKPSINARFATGVTAAQWPQNSPLPLKYPGVNAKNACHRRRVHICPGFWRARRARVQRPGSSWWWLHVDLLVEPLLAPVLLAS
jgi:hypothetical protein